MLREQVQGEFAKMKDSFEPKCNWKTNHRRVEDAQLDADFRKMKQRIKDLDGDRFLEL
jgi:hypothetical protein